VTNKQLSPIQKTQQLIAAKKPELAKMLPSHISVETMERAANNALMRNPDIAACDPVSVYDSVMRCAQDGLIPDGKEAAIVVYGGKQGKKAQYQPMIDGVLKRLRQSGLVEMISAKAVFEGDEFDYWFDEDGEHVRYRPDFTADGQRQFKLVFAYAKLKGGEMVVEVMNKAEVERVKSASKTGNSSYGPWAQWYDRMAVKSALHRLARRLPSSSETAQLIEVSERDIDARFDSSRDVTPVKEEKPQSLLDALGDSEEKPVEQELPDAEDIFNEVSND
jgi:recombination protein RecT